MHKPSSPQKKGEKSGKFETYKSVQRSVCTLVFVCWHCGEAMQTGHQQKSYSGELLTARTAVKKLKQIEVFLGANTRNKSDHTV